MEYLGFAPKAETEKRSMLDRIMAGAKEKAQNRLRLTDIPDIGRNFLRETGRAVNFPTLNPFEAIARLNPFRRVFGQNRTLDRITDWVKMPGDLLSGGPLKVITGRISRRAENFKESLLPERLKKPRFNPLRGLLDKMNPLRGKFGVAGLRI